MLLKGWRCVECIVCEVCGKASDPSRLLLCDDCDISYHTYCLDPPLQTVPKGGWKCKWCSWDPRGERGEVLGPVLNALPFPQVRVLRAVRGSFPWLPLRVAEQLHALRALRQPRRLPLLPREVRGGRPAHPVPPLRSVSPAARGAGGARGRLSAPFIAVGAWVGRVAALELRRAALLRERCGVWAQRFSAPKLPGGGGCSVGWLGCIDRPLLPAGGCTRRATASSPRRRWSRQRMKASTAAPASPT